MVYKYCFGNQKCVLVGGHFLHFCVAEPSIYIYIYIWIWISVHIFLSWIGYNNVIHVMQQKIFPIESEFVHVGHVSCPVPSATAPWLIWLHWLLLAVREAKHGQAFFFISPLWHVMILVNPSCVASWFLLLVWFTRASILLPDSLVEWGPHLIFCCFYRDISPLIFLLLS